MQILLTLIVAVTFYLIGKYSRTEIEKQIVDKYVYKLKNKPAPGVLPFKTSEELELERSGDKELENEWIKSGKAQKISRM